MRYSWAHKKNDRYGLRFRLPVRKLLMAGLVLLAVWMVLSSSATTDVPQDPQTALLQSEARETGILAALRSLQLDIARREVEAEKIREERVNLGLLLGQMEDALSSEHERYDQNQSALGTLLVTWQTAGPGSRLELLLSSDSLSTFLRRLSALRQLDRDTEALLVRLDENLKVMEAQKQLQQDALDALDRKSVQLQETLRAMETEEAELESALAALEADRERYETRLAELAHTWEKALEVFPRLTEGFSRIINEGRFPEDALEMRFDVNGVTAVMREERFQSILDAAEDIPDVIFRFESETVRLIVPEAELELLGVFEVRKGETLAFVPQSGTQGGLALTAEQRADLSGKGALQFHLSPILMGTTIREVVSEEGKLTLFIKMDLLW